MRVSADKVSAKTKELKMKNEMKHKIDTDKVVIMARKYCHYNTSCRACMEDCITALDADKTDLAMRWALRCIAHAIGTLHADYARAFNASGVGGEIRLVTIPLNS